MTLDGSDCNVSLEVVNSLPPTFSVMMSLDMVIIMSGDVGSETSSSYEFSTFKLRRSRYQDLEFGLGKKIM